MKKILTIFMALQMLFINFAFYEVKAENLGEGIILETMKKSVQKEEEFSVIVKTKNLRVAACNISLYFDPNMVQFESSTENTNVVNDTVLYTWYDEQGGKNLNINAVLAEFRFKAKENGICMFTLQGEFYNENEQKINVSIEPVEVKIGNEIENTEADMQILEDIKSNDINNSELAILRINKEGINPLFQPNIKEYYITVEKTENLEVTAIAKNPNSDVVITGNTNLKSGVNQISIKVFSEDKKNEEEYKIYVTVTNDIEKANADLENLAIEGGTLVPEFSEDITNYTLEVGNDTQALNVLAIPQMQDAIVKIEGANDLKVGENTVNITVTAENMQTFKKYKINVKRMSAEETEEKLRQNQDMLDKVKFEIMDNSKEIEEVEKEKKEEESNIKLLILVGIVGTVMVSGIVIIIVIKKNELTISKQ